MEDYFSRYMVEHKKREEAERAVKTLGTVVLVLLALLVILAIRCFSLLEENGDLKYEISSYQEQDING